MNALSKRTMMVLAAATIICGAAGCGQVGDEDVASAEAAVLGDRIPGGSTNDKNFADFKANFSAVEDITDGLGPIFNETGCGRCHDNGAIGGFEAVQKVSHQCTAPHELEFQNH